MHSNRSDFTTKAAEGWSECNDQLGPLPECAWAAPQWITEDAYSAEQMRQEKRIGAIEAMAQACNEMSAAMGWPNGISAGPLPWGDLLRLVAVHNAGVTEVRAEVSRLRAVAMAAVRSVRNPAWAGVCDEDVELERALHAAGLLPTNAAPTTAQRKDEYATY